MKKATKPKVVTTPASDPRQLPLPTGKPVERPGRVLSTNVVKLHKAYHTDGGGMGIETGVIGYFSAPAIARAACGDNPFTAVSEVHALKMDDLDLSSGQSEYYLLADPMPIKPDTNFNEFAKQLRARALAKLSDAEKAALGIDVGNGATHE